MKRKVLKAVEVAFTFVGYAIVAFLMLAFFMEPAFNLLIAAPVIIRNMQEVFSHPWMAFLAGGGALCAFVCSLKLPPRKTLHALLGFAIISYLFGEVAVPMYNGLSLDWGNPGMTHPQDIFFVFGVFALAAAVMFVRPLRKPEPQLSIR